MTDTQIEKLVEAILYEGFILYPYRPSVKNRKRWIFGGLYPRQFCEAARSVESPEMRAECLIEGGGETRIEVTLRYLQVIDRKVGRFRRPLSEWPPVSSAGFEPLESLTVGDQTFYSWQEAVDQKLAIDMRTLVELAHSPQKQRFAVAGGVECEPISGSDSRFVAVIERTRYPLAGSIELFVSPLGNRCFRLTVNVANETQFVGRRVSIAHSLSQDGQCPSNDSSALTRDDASRYAFAAAHLLVRVRAGQLVSQIDPPECYRQLAAANENVGVWPVLVGTPPDRSTMLAAPIILYDYPQIAPESCTTLFDSTEIDEMLSLRIMTLTDAEKEAMRSLDPRSRRLLETVESLSPRDLAQLHGADRSQQQGQMALVPGDRVRLAPRKGGDLFDLFLIGKTATITSIEEDFDGRRHFAVVLDDDPGRDLGEQLQIGHRFFFQIDELEPLVKQYPGASGDA